VKALQYSLDEALASLWRGRHSGLLSTATIALALFVLGAFLLVTTNLDRLGAEWSRSAELSVYLTDDVTLDHRRAIEGALPPGDLIVSREYVSKSDALSRFKQTFGDLASTIDGLGDNPLPASIEVRLRPDAGASASVDALSARLRSMPGVADVRYDRQWLNRLLAIVGVIRGVGVALAAILTFAAALTVANVVRLGLYTRRDELEIMQLVGAPQAYIRGPFVMEGVLQGGLGALVALILLAVLFFALRARYLTPLASMLSLTSLQFLPVGLCFLVVLGGMAVGCVGGLVAAHLTES
jgi:cell division transport system permease protein